jgi:hypothetical protein
MMLRILERQLASHSFTTHFPVGDADVDLLSVVPETAPKRTLLPGRPRTMKAPPPLRDYCDTSHTYQDENSSDLNARRSDYSNTQHAHCDDNNQTSNAIHDEYNNFSYAQLVAEPRKPHYPPRFSLPLNTVLPCGININPGTNTRTPCGVSISSSHHTQSAPLPYPKFPMRAPSSPLSQPMATAWRKDDPPANEDDLQLEQFAHPFLDVDDLAGTFFASPSLNVSIPFSMATDLPSLTTPPSPVDGALVIVGANVTGLMLAVGMAKKVSVGAFGDPDGRIIVLEREDQGWLPSSDVALGLGERGLRALARLDPVAVDTLRSRAAPIDSVRVCDVSGSTIRTQPLPTSLLDDGDTMPSLLSVRRSELLALLRDRAKELGVVFVRGAVVTSYSTEDPERVTLRVTRQGRGCGPAQTLLYRTPALVLCEGDGDRGAYTGLTSWRAIAGKSHLSSSLLRPSEKMYVLPLTQQTLAVSSGTAKRSRQSITLRHTPKASTTVKVESTELQPSESKDVWSVVGEAAVVLRAAPAGGDAPNDGERLAVDVIARTPESSPSCPMLVKDRMCAAVSSAPFSSQIASLLETVRAEDIVEQPIYAPRRGKCAQGRVLHLGDDAHTDNGANRFL